MTRIHGRTWRPPLIPLAVAALLAWAPPAFAASELGAALEKTGDIAVAFIGADAAYSDDIYYFTAIGNFGDATYLFNNHSTASGTMADPDDSAIALGEEAIFGICVNRAGDSPGADCASADDYFYTGSGAHNVDGLAHARVWSRTDYETEFGALDPTLFPPEYEYVVGFEDILGGGDRDYNDAVFAIRGITIAPEPVTMTLLATGLVGLGAAGLVEKRRKRK
jgi:hypothetical protein